MRAHDDGVLFVRLFRNRWAALLWAAGILWLAVDVAGYAPARKDPTANASAPADTDATGEVVQNSDLEILAGIMNGN